MGAWIRRHRVATAAGAVTALALAGVIAVVLAGGLDERATVRVSGDGIRVVRVALVDRAVGFDVTPDVVEVDAGTHVVVEVVNAAGGPHDLAVDGGPRTARLAPGQTERLDLGRVRAGHSARCTIGDHDIAGMTLAVRAV